MTFPAYIKTCLHCGCTWKTPCVLADNTPCAWTAFPRPVCSNLLCVEAELKVLEKSFAYERAAGVIESSCAPVDVDHDTGDWFDLSTAQESLVEEIAYLHWRYLIERDPHNPNFIRLCDEDEPITKKEERNG